MMMAFTKGPWTQGSYDREVVFGRDGDEVAVASFRYGESEDNARLIAAAPDLLAACEAFVEAWEKSLQLEKTDMALRLAKAAIAKARGED